MDIAAEQRSVLLKETAVSTAINAFVFPGLIWLAGLPPPVALGGMTGLWSEVLKASGLATGAMTVVITLLMRRRLRLKEATALPIAGLPSLLRWLPAPLWMRGIVMAVVAMVVLVPIATLIAVALHLLPLSRFGFLVFNIGFGMLVGLTVTPFIVLRALSDAGARSIA